MRALLLAGALLATTLPALAANYTQAAGSTLGFTVRYQDEPFTGKFPGFATRLTFDPAKLGQARLEVVIPLANATIGPDYDSDMRGSDFFDAAKFPQARFSASKFRALGGNRYAADGTLTLRGVSKPVTFTFTWTPGAKPVLVGTATVKRLDFGVGRGDWADPSMIANEVKVDTRVVLQPAK